MTALAEPELTGDVMRAVVDAAPDALLIMDDRGLIQLVNSRAEALFGYHRGELLGREVETLIPARFRGVHTANRLRYRASPAVRAMGSGLSLHGLRADGVEIPVEISLSPLHTIDGLRVIATIRDITDRTLAEARLRSSEEAFRIAFEQAPIGIAVTDISKPTDRRIVRANAALAKMLGYEATELDGRSFADISHPDDLKSDAVAAAGMNDGTLGVDVREKRYRHADGHYVWVELHANVVHDSSGASDKTLSHVVDVTTRKEIDAEREQRTRFVDALAEISKTLLAGDSPDSAQSAIAAQARSLLEADASAIAILDDNAGLVRIVATDGPSGVPLNATYLTEAAQTERILSDGRARRAEVRRSPITSGALPGVADIEGAAVGAPLRMSREQPAVVWVSRHSGRPDFDDRDVQVLASYTAQVSIALELANARSDQQRLALVEDRERIGRDLHDLVIQNLFAVGLSLQAVASRVVDSGVSSRLVDAVASIDNTIIQVRTTIFQLGTPRDDSSVGVRQQIVRVLRDARPGLGFEPRLRLDGLIDTIPDATAEHLLATLTEALSNIVRHARATIVEVVVERIDDDLVLRIRDNGIGISKLPHHEGRGLDNIVDRARTLGGSASISAPAEGGTMVTWQVPITI